MMHRPLLVTVLMSLFFISCGGQQRVTIQYQGSSPIKRVSSEQVTTESHSVPDSSHLESFVTVLSIPTLEGGNRALRKRIEYPEKAIQNNIEGTVSIQFLIDENGNTSSFTIVAGIGYGCEEAVIEAIQESRFTQDREATAQYLWMVTTEFKL